jgi:hypothetical protein
MLPSVGDARPKWTLHDFISAAEQTRDGCIAILQFHGVPDTAHDWVSSNPQNVEACLKYLKLENYRVIALRDLRDYIKPPVEPDDANPIIEARSLPTQAESTLSDGVSPAN